MSTVQLVMRRVGAVILASAFLVLASHAFATTSTTRTNTQMKRTTIQLNSIVDTLTSMGNLAPSRPMLDGKKNVLDILLAGTYLDGSTDAMKCVYKGSRDGWSAIDFHQCVDNQGSGLVVARTRTGVTVGGFNPNGWRSTDDYFLSNAAFLWYLKGPNNVVKCPILSGSNAAVYDYATGGPCFGSEDFVLGAPQAQVMGGFAGPDMEDMNANAGNLRNGRCSFTGAYDFDRGWPVRGKFSLVEVEVYCKASGKIKKKTFW